MFFYVGTNTVLHVGLRIWFALSFKNNIYYCHYFDCSHMLQYLLWMLKIEKGKSLRILLHVDIGSLGNSKTATETEKFS